VGGAILQGGIETTFRAGDFVLVDTKQELMCTTENSDWIFVLLPEALIRAWIPNPENYVARILQGGKGWAAVLSSYLRNLKPEAIAITKQSQHLQMVEHILSLYSFALEEACLIRKPDLLYSTYKRTDLYVRMYNWLRENYMDSEISAMYAAQHFGISIREVHRRFALISQGSTFLGTLRAMRITAAVRMLKDPNFSALTVAEIGYRSGFDEPAYFGRVFRQALGCSPGMFAKAHNKEEYGKT